MNDTPEKGEKDKIESLSFEEAYRKLEETLQLMESEDVTLEESLELFKKGVELYKRCKELINSASLTVKEVLGNLEKEIESENS
ncbi:exodeoxyribonuclease VII small subunit [Mesoaciditoga sp.]